MRGLFSNILILLTLWCLSTTLGWSAKDNVTTQKDQILNSRSTDEREKLYSQIIETIPQDTALIHSAIRDLRHQPDLSKEGKSLLVTLQCLSFHNRCRNFSQKDIEYWHEHILECINSEDFKMQPAQEKFLQYYRIHCIHTLTPKDPPFEKWADEMKHFASRLPLNCCCNPTSIALDARSQMLLLNSRYRSCIESDKEILKLIEEWKKKENLTEQQQFSLDFNTYMLLNRMLICHFTVYHEVNENYFNQAQTIYQKYEKIRTKPIQRQCLFPVFQLIRNGKIEEAYAMHKPVMDNVIKQQQCLRDYEYDMCSWVDINRGDFMHAIKIVEEQDSIFKGRITRLRPSFLHAAGLDDQLKSYSIQEQTLSRQKTLLERQNKERHLLEEYLQTLRANDSIQSLSKQHKLTAESEHLKQENQDAESALQASKTRNTKLIKIFLAYAAGVIVVLSIILLLYNRRLNKINRQLALQHKQMRDARDKANENNRLKVLFLQNMSHDIRNPLSAIDNFCSLLIDNIQEAGELDEETKLLSKMVTENTTQLTHLVNTILEISALESGRSPIVLGNVYVHPLAHEAAISAKLEFNREVKVVTELPDEFCIQSDEARMTKLVHLLLNNACVFAPEGEICIRMSATNFEFQISVEDHGPGIPPNEQKNVFRRFKKLDSFSVGAGLGLSLCQAIAKALKGDIYVDRNYTGGARIVMKQPITPDTSDAPKYEAGVIKRTFAILAMALPLCMLQATPMTHLRDSLENELKKETQIEKRVKILENLIDISNSLSINEIMPYAQQLMNEVSKSNNPNSILNCVKLIGNIGNEDMLIKASALLNYVADSPEKHAVHTYIRSKLASQKISHLPQEEHSKMVEDMIAQLKSGKVTDVYDRYYLMYMVTQLALDSKPSIVAEQYTRDLLALCDKMSFNATFLESPVLAKAIDMSLATCDYESCKKYVYRMLKLIQKLSEDYAKQGRPYRDYTHGRTFYYMRLLQCHPVLSNTEVENITKKIDSLVNVRPEMLENEQTKFYYNLAMAENENDWDKLKALLDPVLAKKEKILCAPENYTIGWEYNDYVMRLMAETYAHLEDSESLLQSRLLQADLNRRSLWDLLHNNYQQMDLYLNVIDAANQVARLLEENKIKEANHKLEMMQLKRDSIMFAKRKANNELQLTILQEQNNLSAQQRNSTIQEKNRIEKERERRKIILLSIAFLLLSGIVILEIFYTLKLRTRKKQQTKAEARVMRSLDEALRSDKERTEFIQNISHEIRTPLNAIIGFSHRIAETAPNLDDFEKETYTTMIEDNCQMMLTLIDDIIDVSLLESGHYKMKLESHSLTTIMQSCMSNTSHRVLDGVDYQLINHLPENQMITTDRIRLQQLVLNLLTNACKYCRQGHIHMILDKHDKFVTITVEDTGIGINPEMAEKIFNRFEKNGSQILGTGLGLHICRLIATRLNGRVYLDTSYTEGSRFVVEHPID